MLKLNHFSSLRVKPFSYNSNNLSSLKKPNFYLKEEFFPFTLNCKYIAKKFSTSSFLNLPILKEQSEKSLIFFHDSLWEEEEKFRSRYCLRIIFALKKYQENNPRPTVSNSLLDSNIVCKNIKFILSYLKNSLVTDLDRISSKFLLFFYFLTKINYSFRMNNKRKLILRNLFFSFIFFLFRRQYFINLSNANSLISKNYILYKPRLRYVTSVFPQGLFLLLYSPYKSSFNFSSANLFLSRQIVFFKRLTYVKSLLFNNKFVQTNKNSFFFSKFFKISISQNLSSKNFGLLSHQLKFSKNNKISLKINKNKFVTKKVRSFFFKKMLKKYNKNIAIFLDQSSIKKSFLVSSNSSFGNYFLLLKFLRKFFLRQLNKFKLRIYKLSFYFYRRFPRGIVSHISKLLAKFRFFFSEFAGWLNLSSRTLSFSSINRLSLNLFFQKIFSNLLKVEESLSFVDSFRIKHMPKTMQKKVVFYGHNDYSNFNSSSILYDKLKTNVSQNSLVLVKRTPNFNIKLQKNFNLLLKLNLISDFYLYIKGISSKKLQYEIFQTNMAFFIESFKFLNNFRFTLKFLLFSKFFFVKKFINVFSTFISLLYIIFNSMRPDLISHNFQLFPLYYYYSKLDLSNSMVLSNSSVLSFFDFLSNKYKNFFTNFFIKKTKINDYESLRTRSMKKRLMNLKFLRQNNVQKFIVDRQNLRNLEFLSDYVKRFVKKLKDAPKVNRSFSFLKSSTFRKKLKKKKQLTSLVYSNNAFLNSKYKQSKYLLYKLRQRRNRYRIKLYKQQISLLKSHIHQNEYFFDSYFYRFHFKKYITRLDFKRQRKRFYINVLFFNKFLKEKRVSVMYHRFLKGAHKITVFHKFSNPFFLRLKLKRYFVLDKIRRTLNRFSFLTSSAHSKLFMNKIAYISFFNIKNLKKILNSSTFVSKFFNLDKFGLSHFYYINGDIKNKDAVLIFNWLSNFKIKYSNLIFFPVFFSQFNNKNLLHFLFILKFLFTRGLLIFRKNFYDFVNEFFYFSTFFESVKIFYINFFLFKSNLFIFKNRYIFRPIPLNFKNVRSYSTLSVYNSNTQGVTLTDYKFKNNKVFKLKYFFFNNLNKRVFNRRKYFDLSQLTSVISVVNSSNFSTFLNFFYLSFFRITTFDLVKIDKFYFLKFFKNFKQLSLFVGNYSFSFFQEKYLFQFKQSLLIDDSVQPYSSKPFFSFTQIFGVGFFTFFYSSFRNFYSSFSRSVYSFILARRMKFKKIKLKRKNFYNARKRNYYTKYNNPNSVYYLSNRKHIYKGFRFFKPNYPYNKFFSYYISYKSKPKEIRKKMFKNIVFFKLPSRKKNAKSKKSSIVILKAKNKKKIKNLRTEVAEKHAVFRIHLYKKSFISFNKESFKKKKKIRDRFFKIVPKFVSKKKRTILSIPSSSIAFTNSIFQSTIFVGNLLKHKINLNFKEFSINPFKKLFYFNKYFANSYLSMGQSNLFFNTFKISKNLFLKFYAETLSNLSLVFLNIKIQRFFRLLIYIYNQFSSFFKFFEFRNFSLFFFKKYFFVFNNYLFSSAYYDLFLYSDYFAFVQQIDNNLPCHFFDSFSNFYKLVSNTFFLDLMMSFFSFENFHSDDNSNSLLSIFSNNFIFLYNTNFIHNHFDSFFVDFNYSEESDLKLFQNIPVDFSYNFNLSNNLIFQFIKFYIYFLNFHKFEFVSHSVVPIKFLLSNFHFSFLQFLESLYLIRFIKKNDAIYVVLNVSFFQFLNNAIFIFMKKFINLNNNNVELFNFILRIFVSCSDYNNLFFSNVIYNLVEKFIKLSNLKFKTKYSFLKSFLLFKNFNISNFLTSKFFRKKYYMYFKYFRRFKTSPKLLNLKIKSDQKVIQNFFDSNKKTFNNVNIDDYNHFFYSPNSYKTKSFKFFYNRKANKFSLSSKWFRDLFRKQLRLQRTFAKKPLHYRFLRRLRRRSKKFFLQKFYNHSLDSKIRINELFLTFFLIKKARNINVFSTLKNSVKIFNSSSSSFRLNSKFNFSERNRLEPFFKRLLKRLRFNRVKLNRRHLLMKSKFHPMVRQKIFLNFFVSPKFFNFKNVSNFSLFFQHSISSKLKEKLFLFIRMNRFLEFIIKLIIKVKLFLRKNIYSLSFHDKFSMLNKIFSLNSFSNILKIYRKVKLLLKHFFNRLVSQVRKKRGFDDNSIISSNLNSNLSTLKFMFFYNFLSSKFVKSFILRYFFFGDYLKSRFQFINRYLWFRTIPLNIFLLTPKIYIIITRVRNNFFLTAIDLYGRILYKSSPGMVKFTGSDRMSKYAWFEASVDFFDGFIEFFRYFLKSKKKKKTSYSAIRIDREYSMRFNRIKKKFNAFMNPVVYHLSERRKLKKKAKKRRGKLKIRLRRFFIISKGISDFNLRIFLKGMVNERFYVSKYFAGAVNYPMRSFSLCRIKKVRRV